MGTGQNCTKTILHEVTKMNENKIALVHKVARRCLCTKTKVHEGRKLHEDNFAPRVNFARVTVLHGGSFFHESKKIKFRKKTKR